MVAKCTILRCNESTFCKERETYRARYSEVPFMVIVVFRFIGANISKRCRKRVRPYLGISTSKVFLDKHPCSGDVLLVKKRKLSEIKRCTISYIRLCCT